MHDAAPDAEYVPAGQGGHDVSKVQPAPLCRPAGQSAQMLIQSVHLEAVLSHPVMNWLTPHPWRPYHGQPLISFRKLQRESYFTG